MMWMACKATSAWHTSQINKIKQEKAIKLSDKKKLYVFKSVNYFFMIIKSINCKCVPCYHMFCKKNGIHVFKNCSNRAERLAFVAEDIVGAWP